MKNQILIATIAVAVFAWSLASPSSAQDFEKRRDDKLAEAWLKNAPWITDYDKALKAAEAQGKHIFAYFTRSYSG